MATFADLVSRSVMDFRVLVELSSFDGSSYSGYFTTGGDFTPIGSTVAYEGRLVKAPDVQIRRDSVFFGLSMFSLGSIDLINSDGYFDSLGDSTIIQGGLVSIRIGFDQIALSSYSTIFTGYVESLQTSETQATVAIADLKRKLRHSNTVSRVLINALDFARDVLIDAYGITYDDTYFDTTAWDVAQAQAPVISRFHPDNDTVGDCLSDIGASLFGFVAIAGDGRYTARIIDTTATSVTTIRKIDILSHHDIGYSTDQVLASSGCRVLSWAPFSSSQKPVGMDQCWTLSIGSISGQSVLMAGGSGDGAMAKSTDDGNSWTYCTFGMSFASEVTCILQFTDYPDVWLMGTGGPYSPHGNATIQRSTDGGSTFSIMDYLDGYDSYTVWSGVSLSGASAIIGVENPSIWRTRSGGLAWEKVLSSPTCIARAMVSPTANTVVFGGDNGVVYRSEDAGSSWTQIATIASTVTVYSMAEANGIIIAGCSPYGDIYRSDDLGSTWTLLQTLGSSSTYIYAMRSIGGAVSDEAPGTSFVCTVGTTGQILYSEDYFSSYTVLDTISESTPRPLAVTQKGTIITGGVDLVRSEWASDTHYEVEATSESYVWGAYGIDATKNFETFFGNVSAAQDGAALIEDYFKNSHGTFSIQIPISYYALELAQMVDVEIWRSQSEMLGTKKCEIMGITWQLGLPAMKLDLRIA